MTTILDRVDVEEIGRQARQVRFSVTILTLVTGFFFVLGWAGAKSWLAVVWAGVAVREGWREGRRQSGVVRATRSG